MMNTSGGPRFRFSWAFHERMKETCLACRVSRLPHGHPLPPLPDPRYRLSMDTPFIPSRTVPGIPRAASPCGAILSVVLAQAADVLHLASCPFLPVHAATLHWHVDGVKRDIRERVDKGKVCARARESAKAFIVLSCPSYLEMIDYRISC